MLSDRTLRLFFWETKPEDLLQRASVEHGQATLMASGSTGTAHDGWLGHPLSLLVAGLPGVLPDWKVITARLRHRRPQNSILQWQHNAV